MWLWDDKTNIIQYCLNTTSHSISIAFLSVFSLKLWLVWELNWPGGVCHGAQLVIYTEYPVQFSTWMQLNWIPHSTRQFIQNYEDIMHMHKDAWLTGGAYPIPASGPRPSMKTLRSRRCKKRNRGDRKKMRREIRRSGFGRLKGKFTESRLGGLGCPVPLCSVLPPESPSLGCRNKQCVACIVCLLEIRGALSASWFESLRSA